MKDDFQFSGLGNKGIAEMIHSFIGKENTKIKVPVWIGDQFHFGHIEFVVPVVHSGADIQLVN